MRVILLISTLAAAFTVFEWARQMDSGILPSLTGGRQSFAEGGAPLDGSNTASGAELILELDRYDDPDYGFSVAIPSGWRRIVSANADSANTDTDNMQAWSEPGYAVGFESPRAGDNDFFADYVLIEVLPGDDSGLFTSTAEHRQYLDTGEHQIGYDRLFIDSESDSAIDVDLVIFQRGVQAMGYTLGFYAIGEPANERALFEAFQVMLRTFKQTADPFVII